MMYIIQSRKNNNGDRGATCLVPHARGRYASVTIVLSAGKQESALIFGVALNSPLRARIIDCLPKTATDRHRFEYLWCAAGCARAGRHGVR